MKLDLYIFFILALYAPHIFGVKIINNLLDQIVKIQFMDNSIICLGYLDTYEYEICEFKAKVGNIQCIIQVNPEDEEIIFQNFEEDILIIKKIGDTFGIIPITGFKFGKKYDFV